MLGLRCLLGVYVMFVFVVKESFDEKRFSLCPGTLRREGFSVFPAELPGKLVVCY